MSTENIALLIGGIIPAFLLGTLPLFQKYATNGGIGIGPYIISAGIGIIIIGIALCFIFKENSFSLTSSSNALISGVIWAIASAGILIALIHYQTPIVKLIPLINSNSIIAVTLSLIIFSEWKNVNVTQLCIATAMIIFGAILAVKA